MGVLQLGESTREELAGGHAPLDPQQAPLPAKFVTTEGDDDVIERAVVENLDPLRLNPHGDRYIVQKLKVSDRKIIDSVEGKKTLYTTSHDQEERDGYYFAKIIAKGSGHRLTDNVIVPMPWEPGDIVTVEKFSGREHSLKGHSYMIVNQVDILCLVAELSPTHDPNEGTIDAAGVLRFKRR